MDVILYLPCGVGASLIPREEVFHFLFLMVSSAIIEVARLIIAVERSNRVFIMSIFLYLLSVIILPRIA